MTSVAEEPFDWDMRHQHTAWRTTDEVADRAAAALAEVGVEPFVSRREPTAGQSILWWPRVLDAGELALVEKAVAVAGG